jgi:hypothetical protein
MLKSGIFANHVAPPPAEKIVKAKLLRKLYVKGVAREPGDIVTMGAGDAQALRGTGHVEIL